MCSISAIFAPSNSRSRDSPCPDIGKRFLRNREPERKEPTARASIAGERKDAGYGFAGGVAAPGRAMKSFLN